MVMKYLKKQCTKCDHKIDVEFDSEVIFLRVKCGSCRRLYLCKIRDYLIKHPLGKGSSGTVFLAADSQNNNVALKIVENPEEKELDHFMRECMMQSNLDHANIVKLVGQGSYDNIYFLVMEYFPGESLYEILQQEGAMEPEEAIPIVIHVLSGLAYAAQYEIIHRDIKPENIYITNNGQTKILDLGLAKVSGESYGLTFALDIKGSPCYMPYEQFNEIHKTDTRSDVYAVGATLYHALCGEAPFSEYKFFQVPKAKKTQNYIRLYQRNSSLSMELIHCVEKSMSVEQKDRYQTVGEMLTALEQIYQKMA